MKHKKIGTLFVGSLLLALVTLSLGCAGPPGIAKVGERVVAGGIALTVNSVERAQSVGPFSRAEAGKVYVVVDVTVENVSRDSAPYNPMYAKVRDSNGYEYAHDFGLVEGALKSGELARGEKARGKMAFEVPTDATELVLIYEPIVVAGGYETIRIALQ